MSIYYDSDFENALTWNGTGFPNVDGWEGSFGPTQSYGTMATTTVSPRTGSRGLQMQWSATQPPVGDPLYYNGGITISRLHTATTTVYGRMYFHTSDPWTVGPVGRSKILFIESDGASGGNDPRAVIGVAYGNLGIDLQSTWDELTRDTSLVTTIPPSPSAWQLIEWAIILNTPGVANGEVHVWIDSDGTFNSGHVINETGRQLIGPNPNSIAPDNHVVSSNMAYTRQTFYLQANSLVSSSYFIDLVAAGNTRIGPVGGDTTPPSAPTGVTVS